MCNLYMHKHNRGVLLNMFNDMFVKHTPSHNYDMIVKPIPDETHSLRLVPNCGILLS